MRKIYESRVKVEDYDNLIIIELKRQKVVFKLKQAEKWQRKKLASRSPKEEKKV